MLIVSIDKICFKTKIENGISHIKYKKVENMKRNRQEKGIALVALVVTLVVLLILAGISISILWGENGILKTTQVAKVQTELGKIEERAQLIYSDKVLENARSNLNTKIETNSIIEQLKLEGYTIMKKEVSIDAITGIRLNPENMTIRKNEKVEVEIIYEGIEEPFVYYVEVEEEYYEMKSNKGFIIISREPSGLTKADFNGETQLNNLTVISSKEEVATARVKEDSIHIIEVIATQIEGNTDITVMYGKYTKICAVKVKEPVMATALEISSVRARVAKDYTRWVTAVAIPTEAKQEFEWSSNDINIATVDNKGVITAKKAGTAIITVKTTDGSNLSQTCEVTIVENTPDLATLTEIQRGERNIIARDSNGNLITVPIGFKVLTSEGTKVTDGIVISDNENEFVWIPVDSVSTGTEKPADDIRLGRYNDFKTKNANGNYIPKQDASNYTETNVSQTLIGNRYQELVTSSENTPAKKLGDFVAKTKTNGGYYLGRYEASKGADNKVKSQADKVAWIGTTQQNAAINARYMYNGSDYVESDLINSYSWDTAIIFIQKYSDNSNYAEKKSENNRPLNTGKAGDEVCNIHDMASNYIEWSTEHSTCCTENYSFPCVGRGGGNGTKFYTSSRNEGNPNNTGLYYSFRPLIYIK